MLTVNPYIYNPIDSNRVIYKQRNTHIIIRYLSQIENSAQLNISHIFWFNTSYVKYIIVIVIIKNRFIWFHLLFRILKSY